MRMTPAADLGCRFTLFCLLTKTTLTPPPHLRLRAFDSVFLKGPVRDSGPIPTPTFVGSDEASLGSGSGLPAQTRPFSAILGCPLHVLPGGLGAEKGTVMPVLGRAVWC